MHRLTDGNVRAFFQPTHGKGLAGLMLVLSLVLSLALSLALLVEARV